MLKTPKPPRGPAPEDFQEIDPYRFLAPPAIEQLQKPRRHRGARTPRKAILNRGKGRG